MSARALMLAAALVVTAQSAAADSLASLLGDRIAGTPVRCIDRLDIDKVRIVERTGIVYEMKTGLLYLNRPASGLAFLHDDALLASTATTPSLCSLEVVRLLNRNSRAQNGSVSLGEFVPYPKPR